MRSLENRLVDQGFNAILLHVFEHNFAAIKLYQKCGYIKEYFFNGNFNRLIKLEDDKNDNHLFCTARRAGFECS